MEKYSSTISIARPPMRTRSPNVRAGFEQRGRKWRLSEFVRIDNVTDRQYIGSVIIADGNNRFYEPSPGRNYLLGINAQLSF